MSWIEAFTDYWAKLPDGISKWILLCWFVLAAFVAYSLKSPGKGRERFLKIIEEKSFQNYYHIKLKYLLKFTAINLFHDHKLIKFRRKKLKNETNNYANFSIAYTESSYLFLLPLAFFYPLLFLYLSWLITSHGGELGSFKVLNDGIPLLKRFLFVGGMSLFLFLFWRVKKISFKSYLYYAISISGAGIFANISGAGDNYSSVIYSFAFAKSGIGVGVGAFALILAGILFVASSSGMIEVAIIFFVAFILVGFGTVFGVSADLVSLTGSFFVLFYIAILITIIAAYMYGKTESNGRYLRLYWWLFFIIFLLLYFFGIIYFLGMQQDNKINGLSVVFFLGLFPLVNSIFDWISLGITRSLLYSIAYRMHGGITAVFWSVLDIGVALLLLLGIISVSTVIISLSNWLFQMSGNYDPVLDLNQIFKDLQNPFDSRYMWLYFMFLSTLIPTFIHLILASWAVVMWIPTKILERMHKDWKKKQLQKDFPKFIAVTGYFSVFIPIAVIAPIIILVILHFLLINQGYAVAFGKSLLESMDILAHWVNPLMA